MVASLYVPSAEFPTYADYRQAKQRAHRKAYKVRNHEVCLAASNARQRKRYAEEPGYAEKKSVLAKIAYEKNPDPRKSRAAAQREAVSGTTEYVEQQRAYREANRLQIAASKKLWARNNAHLVNQRNSARRALCSAATPGWADKGALNDAYAEARHAQMHVDHIIPLKHPLVCGLHVWDNLQLLTPLANMQKNNYFDPESYDAC